MSHNPVSLTQHRITVLLVDDQVSIGEAVRRMLSTEPDIEFHYCQDPIQAIKIANQISPTVILQDLVMPEIDGLTLVQYFRANPATRDVPLIVLSVKEEAAIKAEAFSLGANDYMEKFPDRLEVIARIRYHSRGYITLLQKNEAYAKLSLSMKKEQERTREMTLLNQMSDLFQACKTEEEMYEVVVNVGKLLFPSDSGYLCMANDARTVLEIMAFWGNPPTTRNFDGNTCQALIERKPMLLSPSDRGDHCSHLNDCMDHDFLCVPISISTEILGILLLCLSQPEPGQSEEEYVHIKESKQIIATRIATHYALSLSNLRLRETLKSESIHDPLTRLYNR